MCAADGADAGETVERLRRELAEVRRRLAEAERKLADCAPPPPEERYGDLADQVGEAFCAADAQLRCTHWNHACEALTGIPADRVLGRPLTESIPGIKGTDVEEACLHVLKTAKPRCFSTTTGPEDDARHLELRLYPVNNGVCIWAKDNTDMVRSQSALRESEARYRMLLEEVPAVTYLAALDENGTPLYVSPQVELLLGYPPESYLSDRDLWTRQVHPEDRDRVLSEAAAARAAGEDLATEYRAIHRDGRCVWFRDAARLVRDLDGNPIYWQGLALDITERKQAEEALRESKERYRALVELAPDGIVVLVDGRVAFANQAAAAVLGFGGPKELLGQRALDLVHPRDADLVAQRLRRAGTEHLGNPPVELTIRRPDGQERIVEPASVPVTYHGKPAVQAVLRDVTERRKEQEELQRYKDQLRCLASRISLIEERERRRIASALHDHIAQTLALSRIKLGMVQQSLGNCPPAHQLDEVRRHIQESLDYTRSLVFDLSPPILYEMGLEAALSRLAENMATEHGLPVRFQDDGATKPLEDDARTVLFQAVRAHPRGGRRCGLRCVRGRVLCPHGPRVRPFQHPRATASVRRPIASGLEARSRHGGHPGSAAIGGVRARCGGLR